MVIELNTNPVQTAQAPHMPGFQSSFRPTASTISAQAAKPGESKSIFRQILDFIKKIFCCCSASSKGNDIAKLIEQGTDIAKLIEQGKANEAAAAWVAAIEKDAEIASDPRKAAQGWFDAFFKTHSRAATLEFIKKVFDVDDPTWGEKNLQGLQAFAHAIPEAFGNSSNKSFQSLKPVMEEWIRQLPKG